MKVTRVLCPVIGNLSLLCDTVGYILKVLCKLRILWTLPHFNVTLSLELSSTCEKNLCELLLPLALGQIASLKVCCQCSGVKGTSCNCFLSLHHVSPTSSCHDSCYGECCAGSFYRFYQEPSPFDFLHCWVLSLTVIKPWRVTLSK